MATLGPLSTPSRQPFGELNGSKLRSLQSIKNRQNAITPGAAPSLKRRAPSPEVSDSENVDPNILDSYGKRKRAAFDEDVSLSKPSRYSVHIVPAATSRVMTPLTTPRLDTTPKPTTTPFSAPAAAAGRSPTKGKRMGLLNPRKRFAPPSFKTKSPSLSITAALNGTLAHKKVKRSRTIEETKPKSWFFDIFEESEEQQDYKMNEWTMTQSATILDISDDEDKLKETNDRGKENVDPNEAASAPVTRSASAAATSKAAVPRVSRKDAVFDEPRTPLGDLNPSEFYGDGLDATSVVLVHDDSAAQTEAEAEPTPVEQTLEVPQAHTEANAGFTFETLEQLPVETSPSLANGDDIHALLAASAPVWDVPAPSPVQDYQQADAVIENDAFFPQGGSNGDDSGAIEIWESESAKDENEIVIACDATADADVKFDESEVFALQEL